MKRLLLMALTTLLLGPSPTWAGPWEDAMSDYDRGDHATALRILRPLAAQGNAGAQELIGAMYAEGLGAPQDYVEAVKWYRLAAAQGNAGAQSNFGQMYEKGRGVPQDYVEALKWYRLAAAQGNAGAQSDLGRMYGEGRGVPRDTVRAHMWFNLGAVSGHASAVENRDIAAKRMTPQQLAEAQKIARDCKERSFKGCDLG